MMVFLQTSHHATLKTLISKQLLSKISHFLKVIYFLSIVGSRKKSIPNHRDHHYQNPREAGSRSRIFLISLVYVGMYVCIYLFVCVTPPGRTKNDTDLKFGTHTPIDLIKKQVFCFLEKSLEKLPRHMSFPRYVDVGPKLTMSAIFGIFRFFNTSFYFPFLCPTK